MSACMSALSNPDFSTSSKSPENSTYTKKATRPVIPKPFSTR